MAVFRSDQLIADNPIPSHGMASNVIAQRFRVTVGASAVGDTVEFGYLPHYAKVTDAVIVSTGAVTLNVGDADDVDRLFAAQVVAANTVVRMTAATGFRMTPQEPPVLIVGTATAAGAAGVIELIVSYVVENEGVGYPRP